MRTIQQYLPDHEFFAGLDDESVALLSGCASNTHVRPDAYLFHQGEPADHFYLVRHGRVAIEIRSAAGGPVVLDTVDSDDVVGWSWLVPPYRWTFDARAVEDTSLVQFDAACLRGKFDDHPELGYHLMQRFTQVMSRRLQSARVRLLDLYGGGRV